MCWCCKELYLIKKAFFLIEFKNLKIPRPGMKLPKYKEHNILQNVCSRV